MVSGEVVPTPCVQDRVPGLVREHSSLDFSLAEGEAVVCCPSFEWRAAGNAGLSPSVIDSSSVSISAGD